MDQRDEPRLLAGEHVSDDVSERVRVVIAAAESTAAAIRLRAEHDAQRRRRAAEHERDRVIQNARAEAQALIDQRIRRISELSDSLIEGAEALLVRLGGADQAKRNFESVLTSLGHAAGQFAREHTPEGQVRQNAAKGARERVPLRKLRPVNGDGAAAAPAAPSPQAAVVPPPQRAPRARSGESVVARLVALQMAVAGGQRGDVEKHLRRAFELENPGPILDHVFGEGTTAGTRVIWPDKVTQ